MKAPPIYKWKPEEDFNRWIWKIDWLPKILEGDAQNWYKGRADDIEHHHKKDGWKAFSSAINKRFTNILSEKKYLDELHNQVYNKNI